MFLKAVMGGKAFATEQKLRELKKRLSKKPNPHKIIKKSVDNMNSLPSASNKEIPNEMKRIH